MKDSRKQITLRLPEELYEALRKEAIEIGISTNELVLLKLNPLRVEFEQES